MTPRRAVLRLRLEGPMQSWGVQSRFSERDTRPEPSLSGVIGLLCAALGRKRGADVSDLAALGFAIRTDRAGSLRCDAQTAGASGSDTRAAGVKYGIIRACGALSKDPAVTNKWYLAGASFTVALAGDATLLEGVRDALRNPRFDLYLGRRAYAPSSPVLVDGGHLVEVNASDERDDTDIAVDELLRTPMSEGADRKCRISHTARADDDHASLVYDVPACTESAQRRFLPRYVHVREYDAPAAVPPSGD